MPLTIHFLNVGHGDCTLIEHASGRITMIDINGSGSLPETDLDALAAAHGLTKAAFRAGGAPPRGFRSWEDYYKSLLVDPCDYFDDYINATSVFRYIQTHPDMDHMSCLWRFFWLGGRELENFWDVAHTKDFDEDTFDKSRYEWNDWLTYKKLRKGEHSKTGTHKVLNNLAGARGDYWTDDGIEVLAPTSDLIAYANRTEDWNNLSYVLRISHAGRSIILPGDAEKPEWDKIESLVEEGEVEMSCDVLKAAHHGRDSGYSESAVNAMDPDFVICSVGKKPETDASDEYASHGTAVLSTRYHGTVRLTVFDNGKLTIEDCDGKIIGELPARRWLTA